MKNVAQYLLLVLAAISQLIACGNKGVDETPADGFDVQFYLPALADVLKGGEIVFAVKDGKSPLTSDRLILESNAGVSSLCPIVRTSSESFSVRLAEEFEAGSYTAFIKRDTRKKPVGKIYINIVKDLITPDPGMTVYGVVSTTEGAVENVVVSDGVAVTRTDKNGIYQLKSAKKWGQVFISIPGGYEVPAIGVLPQFHYNLKGAPSVAERVDFTLKKVADQDTYSVFMLGDMHLANRTDDAKQFAEFTSDLTDYMNRHRAEKMYAITLGDMTWDLYWYDKNYCFPQYLNAVNTQLKNLQIFHTMGNHDNDFKSTSDFAAATQYVNDIAPTYYSFTIGKVHYVVLDDIDCSDYDGTDSRKYSKGISEEQFEWLKKDLSYVDKSTPLVVVMHAQVFYPITTGFEIDHDAANTATLFRILDGYKVHFVSGHTHMTFNVTPEATVVGGKNFREHNSGSICASWWWSGSLTPGVHVSLDGTPGGYGIWNVSGTDLKWKYKSTGWPEDYQFRSYDLNNVHFSLSDVPLVPAAVKVYFQPYVNAYPENSNNEVLINIWNWNADWTLNVVDADNNELTATPVWAFDPLHIAALSIPRFNNASLKAAPSFITQKFTHFFKVKAKNADEDLTITVKDEFGTTWTETMQRPKVFSTDAYKRK